MIINDNKMTRASSKICRKIYMKSLGIKVEIELLGDPEKRKKKRNDFYIKNNRVS